MFSARISELPPHDLLSKGQPRLTVGVDVTGCAPGQELVRIDVDPVGDVALRDEALEHAFGLLQPLVEVARQLMPVGHQGAGTRITVSVVPGHGDVDVLAHAVNVPPGGGKGNHDGGG